MAEENKAPETKPRTVKAGDTVHVVCCKGTHGSRFERCHREATVEKVHQKGQFVDLTIPHESGDPKKAVSLTSSPRDDGGEKLDSWHFPESEAK